MLPRHARLQNSRSVRGISFLGMNVFLCLCIQDTTIFFAMVKSQVFSLPCCNGAPALMLGIEAPPVRIPAAATDLRSAIAPK